MSSDLQSLLESIVLNDYLTLVIITAVVYDYFLTFSAEVFHLLYISVAINNSKVEYVWCKPWTRVSAMFVIVRYIGLCWALASALTRSVFVPGPLEVSRVTVLLTAWSFLLFIFAANLVMILRVYALWNRSEAILYILVFIYVVQITVDVVFNGIYDNPDTHLSVIIVRVFNTTFCTSTFVNGQPPRGWYIALPVPRLLLAAALFILAVFQTVKQSVELYRATKQWHPNRYVQKLVSDGVLYFTINVLYQILEVYVYSGTEVQQIPLFLGVFGVIIFCTLIPRFIIGIRELYDRDIRGRFHIDTGFGALSQLNAEVDVTVSAVVFGVNQGLEVEGDRDSSNFEMGDRVHGSGSNEDTPSGSGV